MGRPLAFVLTAGQVHDAPILPEILGHRRPPLAVVDDKAYDSQAVRQAIRDDGALPVIPMRISAKSPRPHHRQLYRLRNIVERFFCRMKDMRRLATHFEKTAANFKSMLYLFAARCWCN